MTGSRLQKNLTCTKQDRQRFQWWTQMGTLWPHPSLRNASEQTCSLIRTENTWLCSIRLFDLLFSLEVLVITCSKHCELEIEDAFPCAVLCTCMWWLGHCNCSCNAGDSRSWAQQWSRARNDKYIPWSSGDQQVPGCPVCRDPGSTKFPWTWGHCIAESSSGFAIQQPQGAKAPGRATVGHGSTHRAAKLPKQPLTKKEAAAAWREKLHGTYWQRRRNTEAQKRTEMWRNSNRDCYLEGVGWRQEGESWQVQCRGGRLLCRRTWRAQIEKPVRAMQWLHRLPPPWMAVDPPLPCYQLGGH